MSYLTYLHKTVGFEDVVLPLKTEAIKTSLSAHDLAFVFPFAKKDFSEETQLFFKKILTAMGQDFANVDLYFDNNLMNGATHKVCVFMTEEFSERELDGWFLKESVQCVKTYSLEVLQSHPSAKKIAWEQLKQATSKLK